MNWRPWLVAGLVLALVGGAAAWFLHNFERVSEDRRLPPKGEARTNPLYALRSTLRAHGEKADTTRWFRTAAWAPGKHDTLVLSGTSAPFTPEEAARLLEWVRNGGHLVMPTQGLRTTPALAHALGVSLAGKAGCFRVGREPKPDADKGKDEAETGDDEARKPSEIDVVALCGDRVAGAASVVAGEDSRGGHRFARVAMGAGWVSLVPDLDFLGNRLLEWRPSRELAYQVLAPNLGRGHFLLVYGEDMPSLMRLLLVHGWPILVPLLLALFAWLLLRSQRFGTLRPLPPAHRRALLEHVQAAGEFAFRRGRARALHQAVKERFERRLVRRDPSLAALDDDAKVLALAERCGLPASRVRDALLPRDLHRPDAFFHSVSTLALMRLRI
jgi:hypothetical protein